MRIFLRSIFQPCFQGSLQCYSGKVSQKFNKKTNIKRTDFAKNVTKPVFKMCIPRFKSAKTGKFPFDIFLFALKNGTKKVQKPL